MSPKWHIAKHALPTYPTCILQTWKYRGEAIQVISPAAALKYTEDYSFKSSCRETTQNIFIDTYLHLLCVTGSKLAEHFWDCLNWNSLPVDKL